MFKKENKDSELLGAELSRGESGPYRTSSRALLIHPFVPKILVTHSDDKTPLKTISGNMIQNLLGSFI